MLPIAFKHRMESMLGEEYQAFLVSYEHEKYQALRIHPRKVEEETFLERVPFALQPVPWSDNGYYYSKEDAPGKYPYHEAGVYYIQEPSAMAPVPFLEVKPGERILDLCAAPGGKSTQIGAALAGQGILVSNEIHPARAKILSENMERMGIANAIVTNESPQRLAAVFGGYFDKILVDAPCSGEGMFRKNEEATQEWSPEEVNICAARQDHILDQAAEMLGPGGRLEYSTCTFAPEEDEGSIWRFLMRHPEFSIVKTEIPEGFEGGRPEWCEWQSLREKEAGKFETDDEKVQGHVINEQMDDLQGMAEKEERSRSIKQDIVHTMRIWPHKVHGEGHYLAVLQKAGGRYEDAASRSLYGLERGIREEEYKEFLDFKKEYLKADMQGIYLKFGDQLYLGPKDMPALTRLRVLRPGLHLGTLKKNRFEPSHALALALTPGEVTQVYNLTVEDGSAAAFIGGQTFRVGAEKGWHLITVDGYSLGWGKAAGGIMKNHYPKGLRKF